MQGQKTQTPRSGDAQASGRPASNREAVTRGLPEIRNCIVKGLHKHLGVDVVPTDTAGRKPKYPYISYKIITSLDSNTFALEDEIVPSEDPRFEYDVLVTRKEQAHFTLSINAYSDNDDKALALAFDAADWLRFAGQFYFTAINIAVVSVTNITDRTQQIVDDFERRYGFDVRIRAARAVQKRVETIEEHNAPSGGEVIKPPS